MRTPTWQSYALEQQHMCTETILDPTHPCKLAAHTSVTPLHPHSVVSDELDKLAGLEPVSPEFNVTRTYLEWLTCLPWGVTSKEVFDVTHAQQVRVPPVYILALITHDGMRVAHTSTWVHSDTAWERPSAPHTAPPTQLQPAHHTTTTTTCSSHHHHHHHNLLITPPPPPPQPAHHTTTTPYQLTPGVGRGSLWPAGRQGPHLGVHCSEQAAWKCTGQDPVPGRTSR
jgi:hypothetical protein